MNATVLVRERPGESFRVVHQDSRQNFSQDLRLDSTYSAAGKLAMEKKSGTLIYVPYTKFLHGVRIVGGEADADLLDGVRTSGDEPVKSVELVPDVFEALHGRPGQDQVMCVLCVKVPKGNRGPGRLGRSRVAVLSVSGRRPDCIGSLGFRAASVAASLVSLVLDAP